jgi:sugar transferase EpsL
MSRGLRRAARTLRSEASRLGARRASEPRANVVIPPRATVRSMAAQRYPEWCSRGLDVTLALLGLLALALPMLLIACLVRLRMGSPVLFRQERVGRHGRPFTLVKFRTMTDARDASGAPLPDGQRLTPLGTFLRRTELDETPELLNVLRGDMSIVGPRPLFPHYAPYYTERERRRHEVRPGLTGWAQINGLNHVPWDRRLELDVWYVENRTLLLDLRIILKTVPYVLRGHHAEADSERILLPLDDERRLAQGR